MEQNNNRQHDESFRRHKAGDALGRLLHIVSGIPDVVISTGINPDLAQSDRDAIEAARAEALAEEYIN